VCGLSAQDAAAPPAASAGITETARTERRVELCVPSDRHPVPGAYKVDVYLPPDYSTEREAYRVLYVFDGSNIAAEHDTLLQENLIHPAIIVSIHNKNQPSRFYDLTPTCVATYRQQSGGLPVMGEMIVGELKPYIDSHFRTHPEPAYTGVVGHSLAGLAALWLGYHRQDVFGMAVCMEPSLWWDEKVLLKRLQKDGSPRTDTRFWIMAAELGIPGMCVDAKRAAHALVQRGWREGEDVAFLQVHNAGHGWAACQTQLRDALHFMLRKAAPRLTGAKLTNRHGPQNVAIRLRESGENAHAYLDLQFEGGVRATAIAPVLGVADPKVAVIPDPVVAQLLPVGPGWTNVSTSYRGFDASLAVEGFRLEGYERLGLTPVSNPVVVDGDLEEWGTLPFENGDGDVRSSGFHFAVTYDAESVYIGVRLKDETLIAKPAFSDPLNQDGLEILLDARPDPIRSLGRGDERFSDYLIVQIAPGETAEGMRLRRMVGGHSVLPDGLRAACVRTPDGYAAEVAIPASTLDRAQGEPWKEFRLNVCQFDTAAPDQPVRRITWQPAWESAGHVVASGTFSRVVETAAQPPAK
jgi:predicted alpha/beta superfamily hydrolase